MAGESFDACKKIVVLVINASFIRQGFEETKDVFRVLMNDKDAGGGVLNGCQI